METELGDVRLVGNYVLETKIGTGSFAIVWRARHRLLGLEVAVKEIDKKKLSRKLRNSLLKEIDILRNIFHPNIVRLHESIQTEEKIYLVLEYCAGGDLAAFIARHRRVSEAVARRLMQQLASGLQVLRRNNLIHRDLKPQNLLLSSRDEHSALKIGDFGFARYLMPQGLADTLCGSPLYMAPEIIQNQKYDAKADLWSVGAVLFQLITGKPPFDGETQFQLFQNILASGELQFPPGVIGKLNPDCIDLCKRLLRRNPVERLTFEEFFNHKFMIIDKPGSSLSSTCFFQLNANGLQQNDGDIKPRKPISVNPSTPILLGNSIFSGKNSSILKGDPSVSIEREYVILSTEFSSVDSIPCTLLEASAVDSFTARRSLCKLKSVGPLFAQEKALRNIDIPKFSLSLDLNVRQQFCRSSQRLQILCQYAHCLAKVSREKLNAGHYLESFSVELAVLALWKDILRLSRDRLSTAVEDSNEMQSNEKEKTLPVNEIVFGGAVQGFLTAFDRAEMVSKQLGDMDGDKEMPNVLEIIFQSALSAGKIGAVDELMGDKGSAVVAYSSAIVLLSFILTEAALLPFNHPFSLSASDQKRILSYIACIESHRSLCHTSLPSCS